MPTRRDFLKTATLAAGASSFSASANAQAATNAVKAKTPNELRQTLQTCLGGPWPSPGPLNAVVDRTEPAEGFRREYLSYELDHGERCPAILLVPDGVGPESPAPAIAVWHQHNGEYHLGKSEPAGLAGNPMHHTGAALAALGYVVLCPDALCFEERLDPEQKLRGGKFERFEFLRYTVAGQCMAWKNIADMRRAVDYLVSRPEVNADRLGCYGHSMGSTHTWLIGPFEPRLKALVGNCCLPTYAGIHRTQILHCFPNFVPGFFAHGDTPDIAGLIAPRALHLNLGETDGGSPIQEAKAGLATIAQAYQDAGAPENFTSFVEPDTGHVLSPAMWEHVQQFFTQHLR